MSFPVVLSPSPVQEAFVGIVLDPIRKLNLSELHQSILRMAEDNVLDYTLASQEDAELYIHALLQVLDQCITHAPATTNSIVSKLPLDELLTDQEAISVLYKDLYGVLTHYSIGRLCEVILALKEPPVSKASKVTVSSVFFRDGLYLQQECHTLLRVLVEMGGNDAYAQRGASFALAHILLEGQQLKQQGRLFSSMDSMLGSVVSWMAGRLQSSSSSRSLSTVLPSLTILLMDRTARELFDYHGGIGYLARHLSVREKQHNQQQQQFTPGLSRSGSNGSLSPGGNNNASPATVKRSDSNTHRRTQGTASVQQLYELCYCLWLLSFDVDTNERIRNHFYRDSVVPRLCELMAATPREKVVRLTLATLLNLAQCCESQSGGEGEGSNDTASSTVRIIRDTLSTRTITGKIFLKEMVGCGLVKWVDLLKQKATSDADFAADLDQMYDLLHDACRDMTRWDVYEAEVDSGYLQWSMIHNEKFFKENAKRMEGEDGNFAIVRTLIKLAASADEDVAAIACYDIGEFVRHYPSGRSIAKRLGAQDIIMRLLDHGDNPELHRHALQCVSKMLIQNWEAVGR